MILLLLLLMIILTIIHILIIHNNYMAITQLTHSRSYGTPPYITKGFPSRGISPCSTSIAYLHWISPYSASILIEWISPNLPLFNNPFMMDFPLASSQRPPRASARARYRSRAGFSPSLYVYTYIYIYIYTYIYVIYIYMCIYIYIYIYICIPACRVRVLISFQRPTFQTSTKHFELFSIDFP